MKSLRFTIAVLLISQFILSCIALIPPSQIESDKEIVVVIYEPYPVPIPEPIYIEAPVVSKPQPTEKPKMEKYRRPEDVRSADRKSPVASPNKNERVHDSGERRGR